MTIHTDYVQVRVLARQLSTMGLTMAEEANELGRELDRLGNSFRDDGMDELRRCLGGIFRDLAQDEQDLAVISKALSVYADGLEKSK